MQRRLLCAQSSVTSFSTVGVGWSSGGGKGGLAKLVWPDGLQVKLFSVNFSILHCNQLIAACYFVLPVSIGSCEASLSLNRSIFFIF